MQFLEEIKQKELKYVKYCTTKSNIFGDSLAEVSYFDFSRANVSIEARIEAVTLIASTCYANPNSVGKETLFNRLAQESLGLPSSSFEFIPVVLTTHKINWLLSLVPSYSKKIPDILLFGESIGGGLWLTNYRALCSLYEFFQAMGVELEDIRLWTNTEEESTAIRGNFNVFLSYIDTNTRAQYVRHRRAAWQELSRRYVSGSKADFETYTSENMKKVVTKYKNTKIKTVDLYNLCIEHYNEAIKLGVQPQEARRCIPQAMYTVIWSGWTYPALRNFFELRDDSHAQWEIRQLAQAKKQILGELYEKN